MNNPILNRRNLLKALGIGSAWSLAAGSGLLSCARGEDRNAPGGKDGGPNGFNLASGQKPKFLIVLTCSGGASILDSFMALNRAEVTAAGGNPATLNCFGDTEMETFNGSPFRGVRLEHTIATLGNYPISTDQTEFVKKHMQDMMVVTTEGTSVNHGVAQKRSLTGNDAWRGRTIQECVAMEYGTDMPLPNLNMGTGGFGSPGIDAQLPEFAKGVDVADPLYFALGLHSHLGVEGAPDPQLLEIARRVRDQRQEKNSNFYKTFKDSAAIKRWLLQRDSGLKSFELLELTQKLFFMSNTPKGIKADKEAEKLRTTFPNYLKDSFDAQAILAYLAITRGISSSVTLGPTTAASGEGITKFYNPPIAFDFSHTDHRGTQAMMWERVLAVAGKLIDLLQAAEYDAGSGESFWDHSMIYFASDFGRDKTRPTDASAFTSGHHLNNASVIISPMAKGNSILGGVDAKSGLTYGFNPTSGTPDKGRKTQERELFAGIVQTMGVDTKGSELPDMKSFRKAG